MSTSSIGKQKLKPGKWTFAIDAAAGCLSSLCVKGVSAFRGDLAIAASRRVLGGTSPMNPCVSHMWRSD
jgi:hypothetical protein